MNPPVGTKIFQVSDHKKSWIDVVSMVHLGHLGSRGKIGSYFRKWRRCVLLVQIGMVLFIRNMLVCVKCLYSKHPALTDLFNDLFL